MKICILILFFIFIGILVVYYRQCEIENFYGGQQIKEFLDNPTNEDDNKQDEKDNDKKLCDEACTLAPINTQINMINTRIDSVEKMVSKNKALIKTNSDDIKTIYSKLDDAKNSLQEAAITQPPDTSKPPEVVNVLANIPIANN